MRAYGEDRGAFERLLSQPHAFIFTGTTTSTEPDEQLSTNTKCYVAA